MNTMERVRAIGAEVKQANASDRQRCQMLGDSSVELRPSVREVRSSSFDVESDWDVCR